MINSKFKYGCCSGVAQRQAPPVTIRRDRVCDGAQDTPTRVGTGATPHTYRHLGVPRSGHPAHPARLRGFEATIARPTAGTSDGQAPSTSSCDAWAGEEYCYGLQFGGQAGGVRVPTGADGFHPVPCRAGGLRIS